MKFTIDGVSNSSFEVPFNIKGHRRARLAHPSVTAGRFPPSQAWTEQPVETALRGRPPPLRRSARISAIAYGVYQIGEVYARSCVIIGTWGGIWMP